MLRIVPALLGLGLAVLWVLGLSEDATPWLTWCVGIAGALAFATVGIIPERTGSLWAGFCLGGIAAGMLVLWLVGLAQRATPWLTWWTFAAALATGPIALGATVQGVMDAVRTRDVI